MKKEKLLTLFQIIGAILFFGGILASIVMNTTAGNSSEVNLVFYHREFVTKIVYFLITPGMWIAILTTFIMILVNKIKIFKNFGWALIVLLMLGILINGTFILSPLVKEVYLLAKEGFDSGILPETYHPMKSGEDMYGAINFFMGLIVLVSFLFLNSRSPSSV